MVLHLPSDEVGFGITFNDVTKNVVFYTTISRFVVWRIMLLLLLSSHSRGLPDRSSITGSAQQCIVVSVEDSVLWREMTDLESQEEDAPKRILLFKPMS